MLSASILRARLTELDELEVAESRLQFLAAAERRRIINDLNSKFCPILTLPPEITSEIFSHYVTNPPWLGVAGKSAPGPLTLAAVCQSWRYICFSTHCLWASLRLFPSLWVIDDFIHLLECWLQRAGHHPLDLEVWDQGQDSTMTILSVISHHSLHLRTLIFSLFTPFSFPNDEFWKRVPLLTKLSVRITAYVHWHDTSVMISAFREAPRLREVCLSGNSAQHMLLPWIQLTHLEFQETSPSSCLHVLKETPNVQVLSVSLPHLGRELPHAMTLLLPHRVTLHHLHTLKFSDDLEGKLLERLVLPALKTIHLSLLIGPGILSFINLGFRSAWSLQSICFTEMVVNECISCLQSLPSITHIQFGNAMLSSIELNELLYFLHKDRTTLPALETLALRDCSREFSGLRLREMLASRSIASGAHDCVKLKSFQLAFVPLAVRKEFVEEIWAELRTVVEAGLEVAIDVA
ncbi:F-box domain-containing protein [Mycena sanguinolenta]|uniref:F-box domain-containing protein n=1 Tax=Mycena sanguinolenta TaxID=230812 RepID=A0A8H6YYC6_9AGAR|nr:F-box domain-containing protein [Mycena sanguinolenta]